MRKDTHLVLKWDWINNNLTAEERKIFDILVNKSRIRSHEYYVVNLDEPYADKVKDIIQKNEQNTEMDIPSACASFKERIIAYLVESGLYYDKTIESSKYHKFIAWRVEKASQDALDEILTKIYFVINAYMLEHFDRYDTSKIGFNIRDCECLTDKDTDNKLFRTLINFRINE